MECPRGLRGEAKETRGADYHRNTMISIEELHDSLPAWTTLRSQEGSID